MGVLCPVQPIFLSRWESRGVLRRADRARRDPLDAQHRVDGGRGDAPHLRDLGACGLRAGEEALRRADTHLHAHRLRDGAAKAGHPHPAHPRDVLAQAL